MADLFRHLRFRLILKGTNMKTDRWPELMFRIIVAVESLPRRAFECDKVFLVCEFVHPSHDRGQGLEVVAGGRRQARSIWY
jgi:hypothetical protein